MATQARKSSSFIWLGAGTARRERVLNPGFSPRTELADNRRHWHNLHRKALLQEGLNADLLDDQHGSYYTTKVNGTAIDCPDLDDDTPAPPTDAVPVNWQSDSDGKVSGNVTQEDLLPVVTDKSAMLQSKVMLCSDFMHPPAAAAVAEGVQEAAAGVGAGVVAATSISKVNHPGIWGLSTGTSIAGRVFLISSSTNGFYLGSGITRFGAWIRTPSSLADATDDYTIRAGFFSISVPNVVNNGVGFEYDRSVFGGNWQALADDVGTTSSDTGVGVDADTWYLLEFVVNADASSVEFFINGTSVATISDAANIPDATNQFINIHIYKLAGTTARITYLDAYYFEQEVSR